MSEDAENLRAGDIIYRHRLATRIWHWVNVVSLGVLLMSGLGIFAAHPRLYWGQAGANADPAWLAIGTVADAFPSWATIPGHFDLAGSRRWHFAFAWIFAVGLLLFQLTSLANRHIARDLHIGWREWSPVRVWSDIKAHARLHLPTGAEARSYNLLQKISYISVIFALLPLMIFTGLTMSPGMDTAWPWLLDLFGGRQSARSIHFICAFLLVAFVIVHLAMVVLAGPVNEIRSMITGRYRLPGKVEDSE